MTVNIEWVKPPLVWEDQPFGDVVRQAPELVEIVGDDFLPEFITAMSAPPDMVDGRPDLVVPRRYLVEHRPRRPAPGVPFKLFQPLHGRYYLVTGALVCRIAGTPDKTVVRKSGETATFVIRRRRTAANGQVVESAWTTTGRWVALTEAARDLAPLEEQFPLQPIRICDGRIDYATGQPCTRIFHYGFIPTGNREKYLFKGKEELPELAGSESASVKLEKYYKSVGEGDGPAAEDYRLEDFDTRVLALWSNLLHNQGAITEAGKREAARTIVYNLGDYLARVLPDIWIALKKDQDFLAHQPQQKLLVLLRNSGFPGSNAFQSLAELLKTFAIAVDARDEARSPSVDGQFLIGLLRRTFDGAGNATYAPLPLTFGDGPNGPLGAGDLYNHVSAVTAVTPPTDTDTPNPVAEAEAQRMIDLIRTFVVPTRVNAAQQPLPEDVYVIRLVYVYDPDCPPVLSAPTPEFTLAKVFDPDAPTRPIRLEMPSITPADLRKYAKGVGVQMSSDLRQVINSVHPGMLKGEAPNPSGQLSLEMICTFSIPIITLVAFIVMFIFLILFNIIFWWLAFIRICLPIPKVESS